MKLIGTKLQSYSPLLPGSEHLVQNLPNDNYEKISGTENHPMKLFRVEGKQFFVQSSELGAPRYLHCVDEHEDVNHLTEFNISRTIFVVNVESPP